MEPKGPIRGRLLNIITPKLSFVMLLLVVIGLPTVDLGIPWASDAALAQTDELDMELTVTDEEKIIIFTGFGVAVVGVLLFLARDIILRRKTTYDTEEYASKKERTYEKYHSEWGDDYEEIGTRKSSRAPRDFLDAVQGENLPDHYEILGVAEDATNAEIKDAFRQLAKTVHPDRAGPDRDGSVEIDYDKKMADINKAYKVLSDDMLRRKYDAYRRAADGQ